MQRSLSSKLKETKIKLQANDKQMARHLRMPLGAYKEIEAGARVLPLPAAKTIERRIVRLLDICGLR
jgi:hypothetical protein